ncbi:MAG: hypothetical protein U0412_14270, partial [Nitrospira sp.]
MTDQSLLSMLTPLGLAGAAGLLLTTAIVLAFVLLLLFEDGRRFLVKLFYLTKKMFGVEVGIRGLIQLVLYSALPAFAVALTRGLGDSNQKGFDWRAFFTFFIV